MGKRQSVSKFKRLSAMPKCHSTKMTHPVQLFGTALELAQQPFAQKAVLEDTTWMVVAIRRLVLALKTVTGKVKLLVAYQPPVSLILSVTGQVESFVLNPTEQNSTVPSLTMTPNSHLARSARNHVMMSTMITKSGSQIPPLATVQKVKSNVHSPPEKSTAVFLRFRHASRQYVL